MGGWQLDPAYFWLGGGHPDLKLGLPVASFLRGTGARVADITYSD